jgi:hypothetical protein
VLFTSIEGARAYLLIEDLLNLEMHCEYIWGTCKGDRACLVVISTNNGKGRTSQGMIDTYLSIKIDTNRCQL